ncbi:hypothetical protein [Sphingomonas jaspsi]|uniref:hypothetical protein n=1 Tax=Sphingomonas jaspsi TaxID=392409 RepID=UPI00056605B8|nr:hypothetical protein [Sphingomonas jaspsi]
MSNYPTLRLGVLSGLADLKAQCDATPGFLRKPDCPYDNDTVALLEKLFQPKEIEVIVEKYIDKPTRGQVGRPKKSGEITDDDAVELETEAKELLKELRELGKDADGELKNLDTSTKLTIIKTQTTLMEKLVSIRERFASVRKVATFQSTVVGILDDLVPDEKRDEFLKRLEPFRS